LRIQRLAPFALCVSAFAFLSCPLEPVDPQPEDFIGIRFSVDGGELREFRQGPTDYGMEGEPFIGIDDQAGNMLVLYAMASAGAYTPSGGSVDYIQIKQADNHETYSGTYTSNVRINAGLSGTTYLADGASSNSLTLDAAVSTTSPEALISGDFSGSLKELDGTSHSIEGTFTLTSKVLDLGEG